jgi:signal transduction histidine kinase/CheY-like chemotaxis protein
MQMFNVTWCDATFETTDSSEPVRVSRDANAHVRELERLAFLGRASTELAGSLDRCEILAAASRVAVPSLGEGCVVMTKSDGVVDAAAGTHVDPAKARQLRAYFEQPRAVREVPVLERGELELIEEGAAWGELGVTSHLGVPLVRDGSCIGAIVLLGESRRFDHAIATSLAECVSVALENAALVEDLRVARAEAEARRAEAERANCAKDEFLAVLGHELRNPLAPIATALDVRKLRGADSLERGVAERQLKHLTRLVDDLLDVSRITGHKLVLSKSRIDLAEVIADGIDLAKPLVDRRRHAVHVSVAGALWIDGDSVRLAQVIGNLVRNAAKYSDPGTPICLNVERRGHELVVVVRDRGIGIDPAILPRIFDPFVQQPQGLDRADGGLGLGLSIVRGIVELHGGTVAAHSEGVGCGTEIVIRLPAAACESIDSGTAAPAPVQAHVPARVLVVDDNEDALMLLVSVLSELGYEPFSAEDPVRALDVARHAHPTIALVDIGLPTMNGYELAQRLRSEVDGLKLVALTGYGRDSDRARSAAAGFDVHLVKPVGIEQLRETLESLATP